MGDKRSPVSRANLGRFQAFREMLEFEPGGSAKRTMRRARRKGNTSPAHVARTVWADKPEPTKPKPTAEAPKAVRTVVAETQVRPESDARTEGKMRLLRGWRDEHVMDPAERKARRMRIREAMRQARD